MRQLPWKVCEMLLFQKLDHLFLHEVNHVNVFTGGDIYYTCDSFNFYNILQ